ncbi:efflux transporter periplasmic adaptor subunit, partial [Microvirga sp. BT325]|nr:efflux transporter periplasmic adaptor subunit [Microvirga splendida]
MTQLHDLGPDEQRPADGRQGRRRIFVAALVLLALGAGMWLGFRAGQGSFALPGGIALPNWLDFSLGGNGSPPAATGPIAYYRDPDSKPFYSAVPKKTEDGRDYLPVPASADVSFDEKPKDAPAGQP